eukprot:COSAG02_NODE_1519_length_12168_cov_5.127682_1_plen_69_part_00
MSPVGGILEFAICMAMVAKRTHTSSEQDTLSTPWAAPPTDLLPPTTPWETPTPRCSDITVWEEVAGTR